MKILMIGPFPGQISGMTIANKMLYEGLLKNNDVTYINTDTDKKFADLKSQGKVKITKIIASFKPIIEGVSKIIFGGFDAIYITPAQSYLGFMKYTPFIKAAISKKKPCYIHFHGGFVRQMYDSVDKEKQATLKRYFEMCDGVVVLGESLTTMFHGILDDKKVIVCENGVQEEYLISEKQLEDKINYFKDNNEIRVLYLSNLMKTKGILELLEAGKILKEKNIPFHIDLAGAIEEEIKESLDKLLKELDNNVTYHGLVKGEQKKELLRNTNIFCLPTYYPNEGQPISILEAMISGSAVVTTNQGGICDIFEDNINGVLCKVEKEDISESIIKANKDYEKFARSNYKIAMDNYSSKSFVTRVENFLKKGK